MAFLLGGGLVAPTSPRVVGQSQLNQIPLDSQAAKSLLNPASGWSLDALVVRNGKVYVARTSNVRKSDVLAVGGASVMALSSSAVMLDVFGDKGTLTVFYIETAYNLYACYPKVLTKIRLAAIWKVAVTVTVPAEVISVATA